MSKRIIAFFDDSPERAAEISAKSVSVGSVTEPNPNASTMLQMSTRSKKAARSFNDFIGILSCCQASKSYRLAERSAVFNGGAYTFHFAKLNHT